VQLYLNNYMYLIIVFFTNCHYTKHLNKQVWK